jgi:hypothetical protein
MVFQAVRTRFPLRIVAGMTRMGSFAITSEENLLKRGYGKKWRPIHIDLERLLVQSFAVGR